MLCQQPDRQDDHDGERHAPDEEFERPGERQFGLYGRGGIAIAVAPRQSGVSTITGSTTTRTSGDDAEEVGAVARRRPGRAGRGSRGPGPNTRNPRAAARKARSTGKPCVSRRCRPKAVTRPGRQTCHAANRTDVSMDYSAFPLVRAQPRRSPGMAALSGEETVSPLASGRRLRTALPLRTINARNPRRVPCPGSRQEGAHTNSMIASTSTAAPSGSTLTPTAARAWRPAIAEHLDHQVGGAVDHLGLVGEVGRRGDEAAEPDDARHPIEVAERGLGLGDDVDGAKPCRLSGPRRG